MKTYKVIFTLQQVALVTANNKLDAEQAFNELYSSGDELLEYGQYEVIEYSSTNEE